MSKKDLLEKSKRLYDEDNYEGVIEVCNEILKEDLNSQTALGYKAWCLYLLQRFDEALTLLDNAIRVFPQNPYFLDIKSEVLMHKEDYDGAIQCLERIFEMKELYEEAMAFIEMRYETCLSLKTDKLINQEKYVDALNCFNTLPQIKSQNLKRSEIIKKFTKYVSEITSKGKRRQYYVKVSSPEAKEKLTEFLLNNGFKCSNDSGLLFLIDVVDKVSKSLSADSVGENEIISESKFYDLVNYYLRNGIVRQKLHDKNGNLVYEGYTYRNSPYGFGTAYFADGTIYREGIFDMKGIVQGKEYYPSGNLRFEGEWSLTGGYGPNAPCNGNVYDESGNLIYSGMFVIKRGSVGWPMIKKPEGFPLEQKERPKIDYY